MRRVTGALVASVLFAFPARASADDARAGQAFLIVIIAVPLALAPIAATGIYSLNHASSDDSPPSPTVMGIQLFAGSVVGVTSDVIVWNSKPTGAAIFLGIGGWASAFAGFSAGSFASDAPEMRALGATIGLQTAALSHGIYALGAERTSAVAGAFQAAFGVAGVVDGMYLARPSAHFGPPAPYYTLAGVSGVIALHGIFVAATSGEPAPKPRSTDAPRTLRFFPSVASPSGVAPGFTVAGAFLAAEAEAVSESVSVSASVSASASAATGGAVRRACGAR